jgi:hypothetical protein
MSWRSCLIGRDRLTSHTQQSDRLTCRCVLYTVNSYTVTKAFRDSPDVVRKQRRQLCYCGKNINCFLLICLISKQNLLLIFAVKSPIIDTCFFYFMFIVAKEEADKYTDVKYKLKPTISCIFSLSKVSFLLKHSGNIKKNSK